MAATESGSATARTIATAPTPAARIMVWNSWGTSSITVRDRRKAVDAASISWWRSRRDPVLDAEHRDLPLGQCQVGHAGRQVVRLPRVVRATAACSRW